MISSAISSIVGASLANMNMGGYGGGGGTGGYGAQQMNAYNQGGLFNPQQNIRSQEQSVIKPKEEIKMDSQILPDISLSRVFKWAIVFIVALTLGKKAWGLFGEKITANLHKALDQAAQ